MTRSPIIERRFFFILGFCFCLSLFTMTSLWAQDTSETLPSFENTWVQPKQESLEEKKKITIAIVQDGPSPYYTKLKQEIEKEFNHVMGLMGEEKEIVFKSEGFNAGWNPKAITSLLGKALVDSEVDIVLTLGILSAQGAASPLMFLTKPVVSTLVDRSELLSLPMDAEGKSNKVNFTFVVLNLPVSRDFEIFHKIIPFSSVTVLSDSIVINNLRGLNKIKRELEEKLQVKIDVVAGGSQADEYLKHLSHHTPAVMVGVLPRLSPEERKKLIKGINQLGVPSFSLVGYSDVDEGIMAGLVPDTFERTARRGALDLQQVVLGFKADELSVLMPIQASLLINGKTARKVGYSPDFLTVRTANFILDEPFAKAEPLDLNKAINMAGERNIDVQISEANTQSQKQQSNIQRSFLLPQADSSITYTQIDRDRAIASAGSLPQQQTSGNLNFSQMVFDDGLISQYRTSRRTYNSAKYDQASVRLDSMLDGGLRYLDLLAAVALLRIEAQNLSLTQDNLDMARLRFEVGLSGQDEVYRWEAQEAQQRSSVLRRISDVDNAMVALNRVLNQAQDKYWNPKDISQDQALDYFFNGKFSGLITNLKKNKLMQEFLVGFGFKNSPNLASIVQRVDGQSIQLGQSKRSFYLPSLGAAFDYSHDFQTKRVGNLAPVPNNQDNWALTGQASLPIFQGGARVHRMNQNKAELMRLNGERIRVMQLEEQNTRSQLNDLAASRPNIFLTREAATKAKLNLDIVQDKYSQGTVGILDLLDAQGEYIRREQEAAIAVYQYLGDLLEVQRAVAWYAADHDEAELQELFQNAEEYIRYGKKPRAWEAENQDQVLEKDLSSSDATEEQP